MTRSVGLIRNIAVAGGLVVLAAGVAYTVAQARPVERVLAVTPAGSPRTAAASPSAVDASQPVPSSAALAPSAAPTRAAVAALPVVAPQPALPIGTFTCASRSGGGAVAANLGAVRVAHHPGYDRIVFEFVRAAGAPGTLPAYALTPQSTSRFIRDASGQAVMLHGSAGLKLVFQNASGASTYAGGADLTPILPVVKEVALTGDFERVLSWGVGLNRSACTRVLELSNPARLVIDVETPPAAG